MTVGKLSRNCCTTLHFSLTFWATRPIRRIYWTQKLSSMHIVHINERAAGLVWKVGRLL